MSLIKTEELGYFVGGFVGEGLDHPECVSAGKDGEAYAGGEEGQVYRIDTNDKTFNQLGSTGAFVGGIAQDGQGSVYCCCGPDIVKMTKDGKTSSYPVSGNSGLELANYPVFDGKGNLYVSDSGEWKDDNGKIFRVTPNGKIDIWSEQITTFPNGMALDPSGQYLYVVASLNTPRVERLKINEDGSSGKTENVVSLPGTVPDGLAWDTQGNLYISCYTPSRIYRLAPSGKLEILAEDPEHTMLASPTNIAFCGSNRDILLSANLGRWHITEIMTGVTGIPLNYPVI
ncbi:SMP-30/gluconolactonase/LRE family protein [Dehalococcoidia bacterium]|nr:SMP-30/gluconolactonase/LRE family protein [Dehalococcoidia bacterium]